MADAREVRDGYGATLPLPPHRARDVRHVPRNVVLWVPLSTLLPHASASRRASDHRGRGHSGGRVRWYGHERERQHPNTTLILPSDSRPLVRTIHQREPSRQSPVGFSTRHSHTARELSIIRAFPRISVQRRSVWSSQRRATPAVAHRRAIVGGAEGAMCISRR